MVSHRIAIMVQLLDAKAVALIITFGCLAIILNPSISGLGIPFPLLPLIILQIWEIPIVAAFLLFGLKIGFSVAGINSVFLFAVYPGPSITWYGLFALVSVSSMMLGVYLARKLIFRNPSERQDVSRVRVLTVSLGIGMLFRVFFMTCMWSSVLPLTYELVILPRVLFAVLPAMAIANMIMAIYNFLSGYLIAALVSKNLRIGNRII